MCDKCISKILSNGFSTVCTYPIGRGSINRKKYKGRGRPKKSDYYTGIIGSKGK